MPYDPAELVQCMCGTMTRRDAMARHVKYHCADPSHTEGRLTRSDNQKQATCQHCNRTMKARDLKRHMAVRHPVVAA